YIIRVDIGGDGALTTDPKPPIAAGNNLLSIAANPVAPYLYVPDFSQNQIGQYRIEGDGSLTQLAGARPATGYLPIDMAFDPSGTHAYVANFTNNFVYNAVGTVSQYTVGSDGVLTPMSPASVEVAGWPRQVLVSASGKTAYALFDGGGEYSNPTASGIDVYAIGPNGALERKHTYSVGYARRMAFDPAGKYLYVSTGNATVLQYKIGNDDTLVLDSHPVNIGSPMQIIVRKVPGN
ncbi:MAG: lactonase family protein, partial [Solimonas sp.]